MEEKIRAIVKKVREMYRYDGRYTKMLKTKPNITLIMDDDGNFSISRIAWNDSFSLYVSEKTIALHPDHGTPELLIQYDSWDELLEL